MFRVIAQALSATSDELTKIPAHFDNQTIAQKRDVFARLIDGYATLRNCEQALQAAYTEMHKLAYQNDVPTKVVVRGKLATLQSAANAFGDKAIAAFALQRKDEAFLHLDLFIEVLGPKSFWFMPPRVIHLFSLACPDCITENGRASYLIQYPVDLPTKELIGLDRYKIEGRYRITFDEMKQVIPKEIKAHMGHTIVDIREVRQLRVAIDTGAPAITAVERARRNLAHCIQQYFSLDAILS
jgi:hypothetical protein